MAGKPYLAWYVKDWRSDPDVTLACAETRGVWLDLLCLMHEKDTCEIEGTIERLAGMMHLKKEEVERAISEIEELGICDIERDSHGVVTLVSRRRVREGKKRLQDRLRQRKHRDKKKQKQGVTQESHENPLDIDIDNANTEEESVREGERFEAVWLAYRRKGSKKESRKRWDRLDEHDKRMIEFRLPEYVATRDLKYQKDFQSFLLKRTWEDQIIDTRDHGKDKRTRTARQQASLSLEEQLIEGGFGDLLGEGPLGDEGGMLEDGGEGGVQPGGHAKQIPCRSGGRVS